MLSGSRSKIMIGDESNFFRTMDFRLHIGLVSLCYIVMWNRKRSFYPVAGRIFRKWYVAHT